MSNKASMAENLLQFVDRLDKPLLSVIGLALIGILGIVDYLSGTDYSFGIFYILPVSLVAYFVGRNGGLLLSIVSALVWFLAEHTAGTPYDQPFAPYWNAATRLVFFTVITTLLAALRTALDHQRRLARTDFLTGIANARSFAEHTGREINRCRRYGHAFSLAHLDVDNFKQVNDTMGHYSGDKLLRVIADTSQHALRNVDIVARLGGDEFALLLPETERNAALIALNKVRDTLCEEMKTNQWPVTFSIGLLTCTDASHSVDGLLKLADELTYKAKNSGKDKIVSDVMASQS